MNPERYSKGWTERKVLYHLYYAYAKNTKYFCRNKYVYDWESDGFCQTKVGMHTEFEVKVTRSDFVKEKKHKAKKHKFLREVWESKGEILKNPKYNPDRKNSKQYKKYCPNTFNIVCQENLILPEDIEEVFPYAGLLYVRDDGSIKTVKRTKIHTLKQDMSKVLLDKFYWRVSHLDYELYQLKKGFEAISPEKLKDGKYMTKFVKDFLKKAKV